MSTTPPLAPGSAPPAKKKSNLVLWIILGVFAFFLLIGLVVVGGGYFFWSKVQEVMSDAEGNPAFAVTEMLTRDKSDLEVVSIDRESNAIKIRKKSSEEMIELGLDKIKQGDFSAVLEGKEGKKNFEIQTDNAGTVEMKTADSVVHIGSGKIPAWVLKPEGVEPKSTVLTRSEKGFRGPHTYTTDQSIADVFVFHKNAAIEARLELKTEDATSAADQEMESLTAKGVADSSWCSIWATTYP